MTIRARFLWLTLGLVVPLVLIGFFNLWAAWEASRTQLNESIAQQAELAATAFDQWSKAQQQTLLTISDLDRVDSSRAVLSDYLNSIVKTRPEWLDVQIVNSNGEIILSQSTKGTVFQAVSIETLRRELERKKSLVIFTEQIEDKKLRLLSLAFPLSEGNFVVARIDGTSASEVFKNLNLPEDNIIAVFDGRNRLLYRNSASPEQMSLDVSQTPLLSALENKHHAVIEIESPYDKIERVYGLARAESANCVIAVGVPSARLYQPAKRQFTWQLLFSLLITLLAILAAFLISQSIVKPLQVLTRSARAFGAGDLATRATVTQTKAIRDLSETFNQMAEQIETREIKLKELDRLKSEFVSSVSHELRTPLTTIKILTRVLQKNKVTAAERAEYLETIAVECDRQIEFVQNLLDLSRIESGAYKISLTSTNIQNLLQTLFESYKHSAASRGSKLFLNISENLPPIQTDSSVLRRILSSLLENALKYSPKDSEIKGTIQIIGEKMAIEISDNGCGIAPEDLPHVFEKFYRGRPLETSELSSDDEVFSQSEEDVSPQETSGVGLGLYLVKNLAKQIGAQITVESPVAPTGRGSKFTVLLPL